MIKKYQTANNKFTRAMSSLIEIQQQQQQQSLCTIHFEVVKKE